MTDQGCSCDETYGFSGKGAERMVHCRRCGKSWRFMEDDPSPEPAAKTELTAEELAALMTTAREWIEDAYDDGLYRLLDEHAAMRKELERFRSDEVYRQQVAAVDSLRSRLAKANERIAELEQEVLERTAERDDSQEEELRGMKRIVELEGILSAAGNVQHSRDLSNRIAELESALALATEAVAAEAMAKVDGLTCTRDERTVLDASAEIVIDNLIQISESNGRRMARWARAELRRRNPQSKPHWLARREAAKAKGDGNG